MSREALQEMLGSRVKKRGSYGCFLLPTPDLSTKELPVAFLTSRQLAFLHQAPKQIPEPSVLPNPALSPSSQRATPWSFIS